MKKNLWFYGFLVGIFVWLSQDPFSSIGAASPQDQSAGADDATDDGAGDDGSDDSSDDSGDDGSAGDDGSDDSGDSSSSDSGSRNKGPSFDKSKWNDSALSSGPLPPPPPEKSVECFGIMGPGQNDNVFVDVDGRQYGYGEAPACHPLASIRLPKDSLYACENIVVGRTAKGELIRGSLTPNPDRRTPTVCYPYDFIKQKITYMNADYAIPLNGSN